MLGIFLTLMMYLSIIGKRFGDAGLADLLVQSEVLVDGQLRQLFLGKCIHLSFYKQSKFRQSPRKSLIC